MEKSKETETTAKDFSWMKDSYKLYLKESVIEAIKKLEAGLDRKSEEKYKYAPEAEEYFKLRRLEDIEAIKQLRSMI